MHPKYVASWVSLDIINSSSKVFEDSKSDHIIAEEKEEVLYGNRNVWKHFEGSWSF
jgi:hypothetical protein